MFSATHRPNIDLGDDDDDGRARAVTAFRILDSLAREPVDRGLRKESQERE